MAMLDDDLIDALRLCVATAPFASPRGDDASPTVVVPPGTKYRCPDCGTPFRKWSHCLLHLRETRHGNPDNKQGLQQRCKYVDPSEPVIAKPGTQPYTCACGATVPGLKGKKLHEKGVKHKKYLAGQKAHEQGAKHEKYTQSRTRKSTVAVESATATATVAATATATAAGAGAGAGAGAAVGVKQHVGQSARGRPVPESSSRAAALARAAAMPASLSNSLRPRRRLYFNDTFDACATPTSSAMRSDGVEGTEPADDVETMVSILPPCVAAYIAGLPATQQRAVVDVVLDLGRLPRVRLMTAGNKTLSCPVGDRVVHKEAMDRIEASLVFGSDNRAGIDGTLHRVSRIVNRSSEPVGYTIRIGRQVPSCVWAAQDLVLSNAFAHPGKNILFLGRPGVGKTTLLREAACRLSKRCEVMVIDKALEIAGAGDVPHPSVGDARCMQVPINTNQKAVLLEAVQNHTPDLIIADEITSHGEAAAAQTIAQRGVRLIATVHGAVLHDLVKNPELKPLVGSTQTTTLGDAAARARGLTSKTVQERKYDPVFDVIVEMRGRADWVIYTDVAKAVDLLLAGRCAVAERRWKDDGEWWTEDVCVTPESEV